MENWITVGLPPFPFILTSNLNVMFLMIHWIGLFIQSAILHLQPKTNNIIAVGFLVVPVAFAMSYQPTNQTSSDTSCTTSKFRDQKRSSVKRNFFLLCDAPANNNILFFYAFKSKLGNGRILAGPCYFSNHINKWYEIRHCILAYLGTYCCSHDNIT